MSIDKAISGKKVLEYIENNPEADGFWNGEKSRVAFDFLTDAINEGRLAFDIITPTYGAINKLLIVTELERDIESHLRQGFHDVAHMLETYKETILEGSFDLIPTDVCQTCHGVGEITLTVGRKPDEFENVDCPDCPDVDVKEVEHVINILEFDGRRKSAEVVRNLYTEHTETLAQVESLKGELDNAYNALDKSRAEFDRLDTEAAKDVDKLNQAVEALERIESLGCYTNGTTEADIAREALESIKGSDPNASN